MRTIRRLNRYPATARSIRWCSADCIRSIRTDYNDLREALEKLELNDASLQLRTGNFQCTRLWLPLRFSRVLHMEIIQERIEREFNIPLITTAPSVVFQVTLTNGEMMEIDNPSHYAGTAARLNHIEEPYVKATIIVPNDYVGAMMELCQGKRGEFINMEYLDANRVTLMYDIPLSEIVYDFFDQLKSSTKGYASFDYEFSGYKKSSWSRWTFFSTESRSMRYRLSFIATEPISADE